MKLKEMAQKPAIAGNAKIKFTEVGTRVRLYRRIIHLPSNQDNEFFPLMKGKQFLFVEKTTEYDAYWFCGTDENPFVVEIIDEAFRAFEEGGEEGFYDFLKPEIIKELEEKGGVRAVRQGDIWGVPVSFVTWEGLKFLDDSTLLLEHDRMTYMGKSVGVLGTRHRIDGKYLESEDIDNNPIAFAQGTLKSPNHEPLQLSTLHLLAQTPGLADSGGD